VREELQSKRGAEIQGMFGRIAKRYDLLNRVLSVGMDRRWRGLVARRVAAVGAGMTLDVCTGTGDVALALGGKGTTLGTDFCLPMLTLARRKALQNGRRLPLFAGNALRLPLVEGTVDVVTVAFGVRNFENLETGLGELARVLRPGGTLLVLEFSRPQGLFGPFLRWWVRTVPPRLGRWISGDREAYSYLPDSVSVFPHGQEMCEVLRTVGFQDVTARPLTGGVATLYEGSKP